MSVCRVSHNRKNPYVQINSEVLRSQDISFKAKGIWAYALSFSDNWEFHISVIEKHAKESKKSIYSGIEELIEKNYCMKLEAYSKSEDGKFSNKIVHYVFFEFKATDEDKREQTEIFQKILGQTHFGKLRAGNLRKDPLVLSMVKKDQLKENQPPPPIPPKPKTEKSKSDGLVGGKNSNPFEEVSKEFPVDILSQAHKEFEEVKRKGTKISDPKAYVRKICNRLMKEKQPQEPKFSKKDINKNETLALEIEQRFRKKGGLPHYAIYASNSALEISRPKYATIISYDSDPSEFFNHCMKIVKEFKLD